MRDWSTHVARSAAGVLRVARVPDAGDAEVGHVQVAFAVEDQVLGFDVAVQDAAVVDMIQGHHDAGHQKA